MNKGKTINWKKNLFIFATILTILLYGCKNKPEKNFSVFSFNPNIGWNNNDTIKLEIDLSDTLSSIDLYFMGEIKYNDELKNTPHYPLKIFLTAPTGEVFVDTLRLPTNIIDNTDIKRVSNGIMDVEWPYRRNVYNKLSGRWKIDVVKNCYKTDYANLISFGITYKKD